MERRWRGHRRDRAATTGRCNHGKHVRLKVQMVSCIRFAIASIVSFILSGGLLAAEPLKLLFLGDNGHHQPAARFAQLAPVLKERGIDLIYSDKVADLNSQTLGKYDGLVIYANTTQISPEQEQALLDYVASGKG